MKPTLNYNQTDHVYCRLVDLIRYVENARKACLEFPEEERGVYLYTHMSFMLGELDRMKFLLDDTLPF